jgi:3-hydroxyanthranilate 3,4-dioxygenase
VCNKLVYGEGTWKTMIVGGPNQRSDYHIEEGEEFFFMIRGQMCLKIIERGQPRDVIIGEGQMLMLPARIPHSPNRLADTVGLVMERERRAGELDALRFYADGFGAVLYEEWFHCTDLGKDLKPVIDRFNASDAKRTGVPDCTLPPPPFDVDGETVVDGPVAFAEWLAAARASSGQPIACEGRPLFARSGRAEFAVDAYWGEFVSDTRVRGAEVMLLQRSGEATVRVRAAQGDADTALTLRAGEIVMLPAGSTYTLAGTAADSVGLEFHLLQF